MKDFIPTRNRLQLFLTDDFFFPCTINRSSVMTSWHGKECLYFIKLTHMRWRATRTQSFLRQANYRVCGFSCQENQLSRTISSSGGWKYENSQFPLRPATPRSAETSRQREPYLDKLGKYDIKKKAYTHSQTTKKNIGVIWAGNVSSTFLGSATSSVCFPSDAGEKIISLCTNISKILNKSKRAATSDWKLSSLRETVSVFVVYLSSPYKRISELVYVKNGGEEWQ